MRVIAHQLGILIFLSEETILDCKSFHTRSHEAPKSVFRSADNRRTANIETRVHNDWTAGAILESLDEGVITRIGFAVDGLYPSGVIHMRYGRNFGIGMCLVLRSRRVFLLLLSGRVGGG